MQSHLHGKRKIHRWTGQHILEDDHGEDDNRAHQAEHNLTAHVDEWVRPGAEGFYLHTDLHIVSIERNR